MPNHFARHIGRSTFESAVRFVPLGAARCAMLSLVILARVAASETPPLIDAQSVSAGGFHTCAIAHGGAVCWGYDSNGQLGNGAFVDSGTPVPVIGLSSGVTAISSGGYHTCAVVNGGVKCWGRNPDGELGNGSVADSAVPVDVLGLSGVVAVHAGGYHTCALLNDNSVRCWGWNAFGELGDGTTQSTNTGTPTTPLNLGGGVSVLALGAQHSCALVAGTVKCWGYNHDGELGDGSTTDRHSPVAVVGLSTSVSALSAGLLHSCAIDGSAVRCWGYNSNGQLGNNTTDSTGAGPPVTVVGLTSATSLAAGGYHACAIAAGGAQCWGYNQLGQLGNGTLTESHVPVSVIGMSAGVTALTAGGELSCAQINVAGQSQTRCWGDNVDGELGLGDQILVSNPSPVIGLPGVATTLTTSAVAFHSCAIVGGGAWCWGDNTDGQLGDGTNIDRSSAVAVEGLNSGVSAIVGGGYHTCAAVNGSAMCWGLNTNGQLGNASNTNTTEPVIAVPTGVTAVAAGAFHSCAIVDSAVMCWGQNGFGELGDGTTTDRNTPVAVEGLAGPVVAISAGVGHTCATISNGTIQCWGYNSNGQLGNGSTSSTGPNPPVTVLNIASGATAIAAGGYYTCAIVNGGAQCWGEGQFGTLGNGQQVDSPVPVQVFGFDNGVDAIFAGNSYACLISSGAGYCWGAADSLGGSSTQVLTIPVLLPPLAAGVTAIGTAFEHGCAIVGGAVACVGFDHYGQIGDGRDVFLDTPGIVVQADLIFRDGLDGE